MASPADATNPMMKIDAIIAERDAEIARLRAELAGVIEGHKAAVELWQQQDYDNSTEIARLRQQVAELQAWKANVPVKALNRMMTVAPFDSVEADIVWKWLKFSR